MKKLMINDNNINDLVIKKSIQTSSQVNHLAKKCNKYDEKIDDWWGQYQWLSYKINPKKLTNQIT